MALPDLTGQNIQDTYKRVLTVGDDGVVYDGTGSLVPTLKMTASYAITEVNYETSSSYAETSSYANSLYGTPSIAVTNITASGTTKFGDDTNDTHKFTGSLHLKGGNGSPVKITSNGYTWNIGNIGAVSTLGRSNDLASHALGSTSTTTYLNGPSSGGTIFSISGTERMRLLSDKLGIGTSIPQKRLHVAGGDLRVDGRAILGNVSTNKHTLTGQSSFIGAITASNDISASGTIQSNQVTANSGSFHVLKGDTTKSTGLNVNGYINANDISASGNITASGNISASGTIGGSNLSGTNTGDQDLSGYVLQVDTGSFVVNSQTGSFASGSDVQGILATTGSYILETQTGSFAVTSSNVLFGDITSSGNISASGKLYSTGLVMAPGSAITPSSNNESIFFRSKLDGTGTALQEWMEIGDDTINLNIDGNSYISLTSHSIIVNNAQDDVEFKIKDKIGNQIWTSQRKSNKNLNYFTDHVAIGSGSNLWPTTDGTQNSTPHGTLKVWGNLNVADGSTTNGIKGDITASGDISASGNIIATGTGSFGRVEASNIISSSAQIDHDATTNFVANEHLDWTNSVGTIHADNYDDTNTMGSGFTVSATTDSNATTITQGDDLMFTAGTGITCETTADGTVTITNTVSDTNTTYAVGELTPAGTISSSLQNLGNITGSNISGSGTIVADNLYRQNYHFMGFNQSTADTVYEYAETMNDTKAPLEHTADHNATITTAMSVRTFFFAGGQIVTRTGTVTKIVGWAHTNGTSAEHKLALVRLRPIEDNNNDVAPVLIDEVTWTALGNDKLKTINETTTVEVNAGDILMTMIKDDTGGRVVYFNISVEVSSDS